MPLFESFAFAVFGATMFHYAYVIWNPRRFKYKSLSHRIEASNFVLCVPYYVFESVLSISLPLVFLWVILDKTLYLPMAISAKLGILGLTVFNVMLTGMHLRKIHIAKIDGNPAVIRCNKQTAELHFLSNKRPLSAASYSKLIQEGTKVDLLIALRQAGVKSYSITSYLLTRDAFFNHFSNHLLTLPASLSIGIKSMTKKTSLLASAICLGLRIVHRHRHGLFEKLAKKQSLTFLCTMARKLNKEPNPFWIRPIEKGFRLQFL